mmetsp:Transcript_6561/g.27279  ORF Transcript_6561/g.27279 Transcript_6561/m.27279 type:complete len:219 (+) Transcript_6561:278-934(+)
MNWNSSSRPGMVSPVRVRPPNPPLTFVFVLSLSSSSSSSSARDPSDRRPFLSTVFINLRLATRALTRVASVAPDAPSSLTSPAWHPSPRRRFFPRPRAPIFAPAGSFEGSSSGSFEGGGGGSRYSAGSRAPAVTSSQPAAASQPGKVSSGCFTHASRARTKASRLRPRRWKKASVRTYGSVFFPRAAEAESAPACARVFFLTRSSRLTSTTSGMAVAP